MDAFPFDPEPSPINPLDRFLSDPLGYIGELIAGAVVIYILGCFLMAALA